MDITTTKLIWPRGQLSEKHHWKISLYFLKIFLISHIFQATTGASKPNCHQCWAECRVTQVQGLIVFSISRVYAGQWLAKGQQKWEINTCIWIINLQPPNKIFQDDHLISFLLMFPCTVPPFGRQIVPGLTPCDFCVHWLDWLMANVFHKFVSLVDIVAPDWWPSPVQPLWTTWYEWVDVNVFH